MNIAKKSLISTFVLGAFGLYAQNKERPNILWLTCEDNNVTWVGCYGNPNATTPNIDKLATEGFQYMNCFANAPVCAPSRSTWITGINAISMGTHPMRSSYDIPHDKIKYYPDLLKQNGYYCSNAKKNDFNIGGRKPGECWDSNKVDWKKLKENQPFFQIINSTKSHESKAQGDVENTEHDPAKVTLHKYHPDLPDIRKNYAKYHDAMKNMDGEIGKALAALEKAGLAENTIVIHNSDHGGVLPRSKRFLFDSGIHCPLIIRIPEKYKHLWPADKPGMKVDRLVSFVDMPKTWLSITNSKVPDYMQGNIFLGPNTEPEKAFHHAFRGRMDERNDNVRAVRDKQFLYLKNYMPYAPYGQHLSYLWKMKATQAWDKYNKDGKTDAVTGRFFKPKAYTEELYDTKNDPDNINNIIENPEYAEQVKKMRKSLRAWQENIFDSGLIPEADMVKRAADNNTTIYEMVRNPKIYNLKAYLNAADLALEKNPGKLPSLVEFLKNNDTGVQYWGIVGCHLLQDKAAPAKEEIIKLLDNDSHEVRAMAAWTLVNLGEKEKGLKCLENLLKNKSYATLKVLNIIDWMGDNGKELIPAVKATAKPKGNKYVGRMKNNLFLKFGLPTNEASKKRKGRKKSNKKKQEKAQSITGKAAS